jgi:hypothetical protein
MILPLQLSTETEVEVDGLDATSKNPVCVKEHTLNWGSAAAQRPGTLANSPACYSAVGR